MTERAERQRGVVLQGLGGPADDPCRAQFVICNCLTKDERRKTKDGWATSLAIQKATRAVPQADFDLHRTSMFYGFRLVRDLLQE